MSNNSVARFVNGMATGNGTGINLEYNAVIFSYQATSTPNTGGNTTINGSYEK